MVEHAYVGEIIDKQASLQFEPLEEKISTIDEYLALTKKLLRQEIGDLPHPEISARAKIGAQLTEMTAAAVRNLPPWPVGEMEFYKKTGLAIVNPADTATFSPVTEALMRGVPIDRIKGAFTKYELINLNGQAEDYPNDTEKKMIQRAVRYNDIYLMEQWETFPPDHRQIQETLAELINEGIPFREKLDKTNKDDDIGDGDGDGDGNGDEVKDKIVNIPYFKKVVPTKIQDTEVLMQIDVKPEDIQIIDLPADPSTRLQRIQAEMAALPEQRPIVITTDNSPSSPEELQLLEQLLDKNPFVIFLSSDHTQIIVNHEYFNQSEARYMMYKFFEKVGGKVREEHTLGQLDNVLSIAHSRMNLGINNEDYSQRHIILSEETFSAIDILYEEIKAKLKDIDPNLRISRATVRELLVHEHIGAEKGGRLRFNEDITIQLSHIPVETTLSEIVALIQEIPNDPTKKNILEAILKNLKGDSRDNMETVRAVLDHTSPSHWHHINGATNLILNGQRGAAGPTMTSIYPPKYILYGQAMQGAIGGPALVPGIQDQAITMNEVVLEDGGRTLVLMHKGIK